MFLNRLPRFEPLSEDALRQTLGRYRRAKEWVWAQEEPWNMGGWAFIEPRLRAMGYNVQYVGRDASASPATGSHRVHEHEQHELVAVALNGSVPRQVRAVSAAALKRPLGDGLETDAKRPAMSPSS